MAGVFADPGETTPAGEAAESWEPASVVMWETRGKRSGDDEELDCEELETEVVVVVVVVREAEPAICKVG